MYYFVVVFGIKVNPKVTQTEDGRKSEETNLSLKQDW